MNRRYIKLTVDFDSLKRQKKKMKVDIKIIRRIKQEMHLILLDSYKCINRIKTRKKKHKYMN